MHLSQKWKLVIWNTIVILTIEKESHDLWHEVRHGMKSESKLLPFELSKIKK